MYISPTSRLPIEEVIPEIKERLSADNTLIITAPPGAGKSTLLPLALMEESWLSGKKILMLEPRRLAARSIAARMSQLNQSPVGETIGYRIRFENNCTKNTRIEILTEGILTKMLQTDNLLEEVGLIIFDEFHERSLYADVALALCREIQEILRPDLRIVLMSATLDAEKIGSLLKARVVESPGKQYPVELRYAEPCEKETIAITAARVIRQALREQEGDLLAFLPGEREIASCEELLKSHADEIAVHPLYGALSPEKQQAAILPGNQRKVILATSIAETSLTIEGVRIVVDCGFGRNAKFNPANALSRLETERISMDRADQRAGRAGRLGPGICYRLWSKATESQLALHRTPEIEEADLSSLVLEMGAWGTPDISSMTWLTPPPRKGVFRAMELLEKLGAMNDQKITHYGRSVHALPCHPRMAHMLIFAREKELLPLATDIAAILEERDPLNREAGSDLNLRIEELRRYRSRSGNNRSFARIEKVAAAYRHLFRIKADNGPVDRFETGSLLARAYPERIGIAQGAREGEFQLSNGTRARLDRSDDLAHEEALAVGYMDAGEGTGRIFLASPLNPEDLLSMAHEREVVDWDSRKGMLIAHTETRIGALILKTRPLQKIDPDKKEKALLNAIHKDGKLLLDFNDEVTGWQSRILSLRAWCPQDNWPDVRTEILLEACEKWLVPYLKEINRAEDFKRINLKEVLQFHLDYELQQKLDELAPEHITVPSGSRIRIEYFADGSQPVLAVRLQEMFGLAETPRINEGKIALLLHLLSPGFKPVQVTSDLSSFWNNTYFEVRKELRRRYPKHVWPDDPWEEPAIRGIKRRNN